MYSSVLLNTFGYLVGFIHAAVAGGCLFFIQVRPFYYNSHHLILCVFEEEKLQLLN